LVCPFLLGVFKAEAQTRKLEFEVASIKPGAASQVQRAQDQRSGQLKLGARIYGNRAEYSYMSLRQLVAEAYQMKSFQVVGPDWLLTERFDIVAKMPVGSRKEDAPLMLQSLLTDRFKLAVHRESREEAVSALVVGEGGPRLIESPSEASPDPGRTNAEPTPKTGPATSASFMMGTVRVHFTIDQANSSVRWEASRMTMSDLAHLLMRADLGNGRPVVDMTGLKGNYEVSLDIPLSRMGGGTGAKEESDPSANARVARPAEAASDPGSGRVMRSLRSLGLEL
jgi:uncharacterized protein (TIGR03435 family)